MASVRTSTSRLLTCSRSVTISGWVGIEQRLELFRRGLIDQRLAVHIQPLGWLRQRLERGRAGVDHRGQLARLEHRGCGCPWSCQDRASGGREQASSTQLAARLCGSTPGGTYRHASSTSVASRSSNVTRLCRVPNWMLRRLFGCVGRHHDQSTILHDDTRDALRIGGGQSHFGRTDDHQLHSGREQDLRPIGRQRSESRVGVHRIIGRKSQPGLRLGVSKRASTC